MKCFRFLLSCILLQQSFGRLLQRGPGDSVDLHNEEFCTDISQYSDKYYVDETERCCTTTYEPNCVRKQKKVCIEVTETKCEACENHLRKGANKLAEAFAPYSAADYRGVFLARPEDAS